MLYSWEDAKLYLILEFAEMNLYEYYQDFLPLSQNVVKDFIHQILQGLYYLNTQGIIHRDLKPHNILINSTTGKIKLCDFGQSKIVKIYENSLDSHAATLWYRAPELLLGSTEISYSSDIWSLGCIFCELVLGDPLLKSNCELGQIIEIFKMFGTPNPQNFPSWSYLKGSFPKFKKNEIIEIEGLSKDGNDLLKKMYHINPELRISAYEALRHSYFDGY